VVHHAGVVDQHVERSDGVHRREHRRVVRDVELDEQCSQLLGGALAAGLVPAAQPDRMAHGDQLPRGLVT
jgi:hypothetical protein